MSVTIFQLSSIAKGGLSYDPSPTTFLPDSAITRPTIEKLKMLGKILKGIQGIVILGENEWENRQKLAEIAFESTAWSHCLILRRAVAVSIQANQHSGSVVHLGHRWSEVCLVKDLAVERATCVNAGGQHVQAHIVQMWTQIVKLHAAEDLVFSQQQWADVFLPRISKSASRGPRWADLDQDTRDKNSVLIRIKPINRSSPLDVFWSPELERCALEPLDSVRQLLWRRIKEGQHVNNMTPVIMAGGCARMLQTRTFFSEHSNSGFTVVPLRVLARPENSAWEGAQQIAADRALLNVWSVSRKDYEECGRRAII